MSAIKSIAIVCALLGMTLPAYAKELTKKEITSLVSGKSAMWKSTDGKYFGKMQWNENGTANVTGNFGSFKADSGQWRIKGNKLCGKWKKIRKGAEKCEPVIHKGNKTYLTGETLMTF